MKTLILETSSEKGCLLLAKKGVPIAVKPLPGGADLSKCLASEVKNLLDGQIPALVAVGIGPGSYTGIRVGAALAKGLSYGWQIPCIGFCSLEAFGPGPLLADARKGGFYALIRRQVSLITPSDPSLYSLPSISSPHPELIQKRLPFPLLLREVDPDPLFLAELVYRQFLEKGIVPFKLTYFSPFLEENLSNPLK